MNSVNYREKLQSELVDNVNRLVTMRELLVHAEFELKRLRKLSFKMCLTYPILFFFYGLVEKNRLSQHSHVEVECLKEIYKAMPIKLKDATRSVHDLRAEIERLTAHIAVLEFELDHAS